MEVGGTRLSQLVPRDREELWRKTVGPALAELMERAIVALDRVIGKAEVDRAYRRRFRERDCRGLAYEILVGGGLAEIGQDLEPQVPSGVGKASFDWRIRVSGIIVNCEVKFVADLDSFPGNARTQRVRYAYDPKARGNEYASLPRVRRGECADVRDKLADKIREQLPPAGGPNVVVLFHESAVEYNLAYVATALYGSRHYLSLATGNWEVLNQGVMSDDGAWTQPVFAHVAAVIGVSPQHGDTDLSLEVKGFINPRATMGIARPVLGEMMRALAPEVWES